MSADTEYFAAMLSQELELTQQIHGILQQEKEALRANDLPVLQQLQQSSGHSLNRLKEHAAGRLQWMASHGLPHSSACLDHPDLQQAANIRLLWQQLEAQYRTNQSLSQQLSDIVLGARQQTIQKLKILRGRENDPHLYDNKGNASNLNQGQGYIQA